MGGDRRPANDPRTLARDIPGLFDALFPQLAPGVVVHFNRRCYVVPECAAVPAELIADSKLQRAMLFEVGVAAGEQLLVGNDIIDWNLCLDTALARQRRHFDATLPDALSAADKAVAQWVAGNLVAMLGRIQAEAANDLLVRSPTIPGYQWIASGVGDFSIGTNLVEVKCTNKRFSSSDYRQIVMYWLLSYASSVEHGTPEWTIGILLNPRLNFVVKLPFEEIIGVIGAGRSKVELLARFSSMVGDRSLNVIDPIR